MFKKRKVLCSDSSFSLHIILLTVLFLSVSVSGEAKRELDALTGGIHTRVAWREGGDPIEGGSDIIKGFDSKTGEIHTIWKDGAVKSVLAAGGNKLLLTSLDYKVWVVDWDGTNKSQLAPGSVSDGWRDPKTGKDWAILREKSGIYRVRIDNPGMIVKIYEGAEGHKVYPWFQISADGKKAASFFPWPKSGVWDAHTQKVTYLSDGGWSSMASDNSYFWFHLEYGHKSLATFRDKEKIASFNVMPPFQGAQIYCPRAAEGPEHGGLYFTLCGGYPEYNLNGNTVEIFVGKMNSTYDGVAGWARITYNNLPDHHPTTWVGVEDVYAPSSMSLSTDTLSFTAEEGASSVESRTVTVTPEKGTLGNVIAVSDQTWLHVAVKESGNNWEIETRPDITGLSPNVYKALVEVNAINAESKTYEVELTVRGVAKLTTISISPLKSVLMPGNIKSFSVEALDQYGKPVSPKPSIIWSANNGAEIDGDGMFTAPINAGEYSVTAQAGDIKGSAEVIVVTMEITSNHKDKIYFIGDQITVTWTVSDGITGVNLWISLDDGKTWILINKLAPIDITEYNGSFSWTIPSEFNGIPLQNTATRFKVADYWNENIYIQSESIFISSAPTIITKGVSPSIKPLSLKMIGPKTLDLQVNRKGLFEIQFIDSKGKTVEKFSGCGPLNFRWTGETVGVYMVRLHSMFGEINKKVIVW